VHFFFFPSCLQVAMWLWHLVTFPETAIVNSSRNSAPSIHLGISYRVFHAIFTIENIGVLGVLYSKCSGILPGTTLPVDSTRLSEQNLFITSCQVVLLNSYDTTST
jgi:hypothetical protein